MLVSHHNCSLRRIVDFVVVLVALVCAPASVSPTNAQASDQSPVVTKIEPPNWWIGLTPQVMLLVSGRHLEATQVSCNLPSLIVERSQATSGGNYLFVWLKLGTETKSGTAVCRITTATGVTSFELPIKPREQTIHRFQGLGPADVIYLIVPDRFANGDPTNDEPAEAPGSHDRAKPRAYHGGDLRGIREQLDYFKELGVTTIWLTPIVKNGATEDYHGYGAVDLYAVDPHLGTLRDYQDLVSAAHQQKMKVLFDVVPNHVGPRHPWLDRPPLPDWFHGTRQQHSNSSAPLKGSFYGQTEQQAAGHDPFEVLADPHAPKRLTQNLTQGWFFGILPDLNTENPVVAQYLLQNAVWWAESSGLDGFRVDTFPYVSRVFWSRWHAGLRKIYPRLTTIGEVFHPDPTVTSFFAGGQKRFDGIDTGVSTVFDYPLYFALRGVLLSGASAGRIVDVLRHDSEYPRPDDLVTFFANHDVPRLSSAAGNSLAKMKLAFGLVLTLRGIPQLYYGDEIGIPGGGDPDNRLDFPGGWREDPRNAFIETGRTREQQELFAFVQRLLQVRRAHAALSVGRLWHLYSDDSAYVFARVSEEDRVLVVFNNAAQPRDIRLSLIDTPVEQTQNLSRLFGDANAQLVGQEVRAHAPAESLSVFVLE